MIIVLLGASGSGKSTIESRLNKAGFGKIVSYTTRDRRANETNGVDYHFINEGTFKDMKDSELFAEWDEYSENRFYGTVISDYLDEVDKVCVLTPNGLRQLRKNVPTAKVFSVFIDAPLGTRFKRYIDRIGEDKFDFRDKNEISSRTERDWAMFLGMEYGVDMVVNNDSNADIDNIAEEIIRKANRKFYED